MLKYLVVPVDVRSQFNVVVERNESFRNSNIITWFLFGITRGRCRRFNSNIFALLSPETFLGKQLMVSCEFNSH